MAKMQQNMTPRQLLEQKFKVSRTYLLLMIILTAVNIGLLIGGSETVMLFSASIPYYVVVFPAVGGEYELFLVGCALAFVILLVYFICWILSKKRPGWLVVALVMFILDTLALLGLYLMAEELLSGVIDFLIHALLIYYMAVGISSARKLKTMPAEAAEEVTEHAGENTAPLYRADDEAKNRVLLEHVHGTYRIVYRRVKHTNELVINGYVYDTYEAKLEFPHVLQAVMDGHRFEVGYSSTSRSYLLVDGQKVAEKVRWY